MTPKPPSSMVSWCYQAMRTMPSGHWAAASKAEQADMRRCWLNPASLCTSPPNPQGAAKRSLPPKTMQWGQQQRTSKTQIQSSRGCLHNFSLTHKKTLSQSLLN